jgi:hypothetical protein
MSSRQAKSRQVKRKSASAGGEGGPVGYFNARSNLDVCVACYDNCSEGMQALLTGTNGFVAFSTEEERGGHAPHDCTCDICQKPLAEAPATRASVIISLSKSSTLSNADIAQAASTFPYSFSPDMLYQECVLLGGCDAAKVTEIIGILVRENPAAEPVRAIGARAYTATIDSDYPFDALNIRNQPSQEGEILGTFHLPRHFNLAFKIDTNNSTSTYWRLAPESRAILARALDLRPFVEFNEAYIVKRVEGHETLDVELPPKPKAQSAWRKPAKVRPVARMAEMASYGGSIGSIWGKSW